MAVNDFYRVDAQSSLGSGDTLHNMFVYKLVEDGSAVTPTENAICQFLNAQFSTHVLGSWFAIVSEDWRLENLHSAHIGGVAFNDLPGGAGYEGLVAAESLPRFLSYNIMLNREDATTRNGHKRIAGVPESWQDNGTFTGDSGLMGDFLEAIGTSFTYTEGDYDLTFAPYIVRLNSTGTAVTASTPVAHATFRGFGTQNSRKS